MPAIVVEDEYRAWLDPREKEAEAMMEMLKPYPAELLTARPVSRVVNSPKNDSRECIAPLVEEKDTLF
jgi:putative SOS response-associated peptidase YedK